MKIKLVLLALALVVPVFCSTAAPAKARPKIKVDFLQPKTSNVVSGQIEVRVRFIPEPGAAMPREAMAGIGGAPWVKLTKAETGNYWEGVVDTSLSPNGAQELMIVSDQRFGRGFQRLTVTNSLNCFFSDLHSHTSYSDGTLTPAVAHAFGRDVAKLDVFALTDHLELLTDAEWMDIREQAEKANHEGKFVTLLGLEWTKKIGHTCIYDPKTRVWPANLPEFYQAAADAGVLVKFNHPGDGTQVFNGLAYSKVGDAAVELMEVRSAQEELAYIRALNNGWHLAPDGSDDTHSATWGARRAWTGIWAPALSRKNIWEALKARRCFSTQDRNCKLLFRANGVPMGSIIEDPVSVLDIQVKVEDPDTNDRIARLELFQNGKVIESTHSQSSSADWSTVVNVAPGSHYFFVKVTQTDTNSAWSAPIWIRR